MTWCSTTSAFSCIDRACVWDCAGQRSCNLLPVDGGCLDCGDAGSTCALGLCTASTRVAHLEQTTCAGYTVGTTFTVTEDTACNQVAVFQDGGVAFGDWKLLFSGGTVGHIPAAGGTCVGVGLPTQIERYAFSCPDCQFVIAF